jgi:ammonia channel protein AmtB
MEINKFIKGIDRLMFIPKDKNKLERRLTLHKLIDFDNGIPYEDRSHNIKWYSRFTYYYFFHFILFFAFLAVILSSDFIHEGLSHCIFRDYRFKVIVVYMICLILLVYFKIWFNVWKIKIWSNMDIDPYK